MVDAAAFLSSINAAERETICKFKEEKKRVNALFMAIIIILQPACIMMLATSVLTLLFRAQGSSKSINVGVAGDAGRIFYEDSPNLFSKFHICALVPLLKSCYFTPQHRKLSVLPLFIKIVSSASQGLHRVMSTLEEKLGLLVCIPTSFANHNIEIFKEMQAVLSAHTNVQ